MRAWLCRLCTVACVGVACVRARVCVPFVNASLRASTHDATLSRPRAHALALARLLARALSLSLALALTCSLSRVHARSLSVLGTSSHGECRSVRFTSRGTRRPLAPTRTRPWRRKRKADSTYGASFVYARWLGLMARGSWVGGW